MSSTSGPDALAPREAEVANGVADGMSNREIASELRLAEQTVKNYLSTIYRKLGVHSRTALIVALRDAGRRPDQN